MSLGNTFNSFHNNIISNPALGDPNLDSRRGKIDIADSYLRDIFLPKGTIIKDAYYDKDAHKLILEVCHPDLDIIDDDEVESPLIMIQYERVEIERKFFK